MSATDYNSELVLPVSMDAERSILSSILMDPSLYDQAAEKLIEDSFSLSAHRTIYARMRDLQESGRPIDFGLLIEELKQRKELEAIGGTSYVSQLIDGAVERSSIEHYIRIVHNKAKLRGVINIAQAAISEALEQSEEADDIASRAELQLSQLNDHGGSKGFETMSEIVRTSFGSLEELFQRNEDITGLATEYTLLDRLTGGLQPADLIILAARPSMGKTALAMNIAENAGIQNEKVVAVFSLEMSKKSLLMRMLASLGRVDATSLRNGYLTKADQGRIIHATDQLAGSKIVVDDTPAITLSEMRSKARRLKRQHKQLDLIIVDYLQLMGTPRGAGKINREQEVSMNSRGLKALAKELQVPVLVLAQLNRESEKRSDHRPQLSDLRESGSIEQDADVVAFIFREEVYKKDEPDLEGIAELIVAKQRNGPTDTIKLAFQKRFTRFDNLAIGFGD